MGWCQWGEKEQWQHQPVCFSFGFICFSTGWCVTFMPSTEPHPKVNQLSWLLPQHGHHMLSNKGQGGCKVQLLEGGGGSKYSVGHTVLKLIQYTGKIWHLVHFCIIASDKRSHVCTLFQNYIYMQIALYYDAMLKGRWANPQKWNS